MKIKKQGKNENLDGRSILNTKMCDELENEIVIDTAILGGLGSEMDVFLEGKNTSGGIEMMISLNGSWINRTQRRYETEEEALKDHKEIVKNFKEKKINHILTFHEVCGGGNTLSEEDNLLRSLIRTKKRR